MKKNRRALPFVLIVIGLWLLSGCIYVPMFGRPIEGKNAARKVGDADSRKPIRVGVTHVEDIRGVLGDPLDQTSDGRVLVYGWTTQNGATIWPLCFKVDGVDRRNTLVLRLDDRNVLKSFEVLVDNEPLLDWIFTQVPKSHLKGFWRPIPPEIVLDRSRRRGRQTPPSTTQPF